MHELHEIYETLNDLKFCASQADFSRQWLGKSEGYYAYLKASSEAPALSSIGMLIGRLQSICPTVNDSRYWEERRRLRSAIVKAKTMWQGEFELTYLPPWSRVTAI